MFGFLLGLGGDCALLLGVGFYFGIDESLRFLTW